MWHSGRVAQWVAKRSAVRISFNDWIFCRKDSITKTYAGHGGGQVVRVLAFYFNDPSSIPAEIKKICEIVEKNENKQKEAGIVQF